MTDDVSMPSGEARRMAAWLREARPVIEGDKACMLAWADLLDPPKPTLRDADVAWLRGEQS